MASYLKHIPCRKKSIAASNSTSSPKGSGPEDLGEGCREFEEICKELKVKMSKASKAV